MMVEAVMVGQRSATAKMVEVMAVETSIYSQCEVGRRGAELPHLKLPTLFS